MIKKKKRKRKVFKKGLATTDASIREHSKTRKNFSISNFGEKLFKAITRGKTATGVAERSDKPDLKISLSKSSKPTAASHQKNVLTASQKKTINIQESREQCIKDIGTKSSGAVAETTSPKKSTYIETAKWKSVSRAEDSWQRHNGKYNDERDIVIGFDFGTACTKVVLQDQQLKSAFAVRFEQTLTGQNPYLLPSKIYIRDNGSMTLSSQGTLISELKLRFIQGPEKTVCVNPVVTSCNLFTAYIALVLIEVRKWFWDHYYSNYAHVNISWQLNIGMPSSSYDDENLFNQLKKSALTAWNLTLFTNTEIAISDINKADCMSDVQLSDSTCDKKSGQIHPDLVTPIPEIIAEVVGFARSPLRHNGMFLLMDVGASTLDVSSFTIHDKEGDDYYPIWAANVEKLGAYILHQFRIDACKQIINENINRLNQSCDGINALPERSEYIKILKAIDDEEIEPTDKRFLKDCSIFVRSVIRETKNRRNPAAIEWQRGLPFFICGGGANIVLYQSIINDANQGLKRAGIAPLQKKSLPKPENLKGDDLNQRDFHRIAVAYGLSFNLENIGQIIPERMIADYTITTPVREIENQFIEKEMT